MTPYPGRCARPTAPIRYSGSGGLKLLRVGDPNAQSRTVESTQYSSCVLVAAVVSVLILSVSRFYVIVAGAVTISNAPDVRLYVIVAGAVNTYNTPVAPLYVIVAGAVNTYKAPAATTRAARCAPRHSLRSFLWCFRRRASSSRLPL
ncbi:hypothetical protein JCM31271_21530 [Halorubrum trueperi]